MCKINPSVLKNTFLSSSWDTTAALWRITAKSDNTYESVLLTMFKGHTAAVWSAIQLTKTLVVTCSADKTIIIHDVSPDEPDYPSVISKILIGIYFSIIIYLCLYIWSINVKYRYTILF